MGRLKEEKLQVLATAKEYLEKLINGSQQLINMYHSGDVEQANVVLSYFPEGLKWLIDVFTLTNDVQVEKIQALEIIPLLQQITEAVENSDYVLISDLVEYEMLPVITNWHQKLILTIGN